MPNNLDKHPSVQETFDTITRQWEDYLTTNNQFNRALLLKGIDFATEKHFNQMRTHNDKVPYIVHPLRVTALLWETGNIRKEELLLAALLHDTLEDTNTSPQEISSLFGEQVLALVLELTEKPQLSMEEEIEHTHSLSQEAKIIKLADRTHNLKDLLDHPPMVWRRDKVQAFLQRSKNILYALSGTHKELEKAFKIALDELENT